MNIVITPNLDGLAGERIRTFAARLRAAVSRRNPRHLISKN